MNKEGAKMENLRDETREQIEARLSEWAPLTPEGRNALLEAIKNGIRIRRNDTELREWLTGKMNHDSLEVAYQPGGYWSWQDRRNYLLIREKGGEVLFNILNYFFTNDFGCSTVKEIFVKLTGNLPKYMPKPTPNNPKDSTS